MPDENTTEMVNENKATEMEAENQEGAKSEIDPKAELEAVRAALKKANAEAAKYRKAAEQVEAERKAKQEAEMTELQKAQKEAAEVKAQLAARDLADLKRKIAEKVGLPPALAVRLQGTADEEIEADAKALLESLPKPAEPQKKPSQIIPANPNSAQLKETEAERKARIFGEKVDIFDPQFMQEHGGGVFFNEPKKD